MKNKVVLLVLMLIGLGMYQSNFQAFAEEKAAPAAVASPEASVAPAESSAPAAEAIKIPEPPEEKISWVQAVVDSVASFPWAGKYLAWLFSILAILAAVATALATCLMAVSVALDKMGKKVPFLSVAKEYIDAVNKWVKYVSMYNVQKDASEEKIKLPKQ
jgi:hypothetical protein